MTQFKKNQVSLTMGNRMFPEFGMDAQQRTDERVRVLIPVIQGVGVIVVSVGKRMMLPIKWLYLGVSNVGKEGHFSRECKYQKKRVCFRCIWVGHVKQIIIQGEQEG